MLFVCLGVCTEFYFAVFVEIDGGPFHERLRRDRTGHPDVYWERVEPKTVSFTMQEIILFGNLLYGNKFHVMQTRSFTILIFLSICGTCSLAALVLRVVPLSLKASRNTSNSLSMNNVFIKMFLFV